MARLHILLFLLAITVATATDRMRHHKHRRAGVAQVVQSHTEAGKKVAIRGPCDAKCEDLFSASADACCVYVAYAAGEDHHFGQDKRCLVGIGEEEFTVGREKCSCKAFFKKCGGICRDDCRMVNEEKTAAQAGDPCIAGRYQEPAEWHDLYQTNPGKAKTKCAEIYQSCVEYQGANDPDCNKENLVTQHPFCKSFPHPWK